MKNKSSHSKICILLSLIIFLFPVTLSSAEDSTQSSAGIAGYFVKISDTEAEMRLAVTFQTPRKVISSIELQYSPVNTEDYIILEGPYRKIGYNKVSLSRLLYFEVKENYQYRIKYEVTDILEGVTTTISEYKYLQ